MKVESVNSLKKTIEYIKEGLNEWRYHNEESGKQGIVLPILHSLGWNIYDTKIVVPEYNICGKSVDYALCYDFYKDARILIEVKGIDKPQQKTAFNAEIEKIRNEYCEGANIDYAIYTNGLKWHFLSRKNDDIFHLNLLEDDIDELVNKFSDYLGYDKCKIEPLMWSKNDEKAETEKSSLYIDSEHVKSCVLNLRDKPYPIHTHASVTEEGWRNVLVKVCQELITEKNDIKYFTTSPVFSGSIKTIFKSIGISKDYKEISPGFYVNTKLGNNGFCKILRMLMRYFNIPSSKVYFTNVQ